MGACRAVNFELNDDQTQLRDLIDKFVTGRYDLARRLDYQAEDGGFSRANWHLLAELGLLALPFRAEDGGLDGGPVEIITMMEALGRGLVTEPVLGTILIAGAMLQSAGTDAQKAAWIPRLAGGDAQVALAHAEHAARFNLSHVDTKARREGSQFVLTGAKTMVLAGRTADAYIVSARDEDGLALYLVAADAKGLHRNDYRLIDGSVASEVRLDAVIASGKLAGGLKALSEAIDNARIAICAELVGIMSMLFDTTLEYLRTRKQFDAPIGSFQAIQHRMADVYVLLEQSRSHLYRCTLASGSPNERSRAIAAAKSYIGASAVRLGEECIQFHGGIGTCDELIIGHGHKRILLLATLFGDADGELQRYNRLFAEGIA